VSFGEAVLVLGVLKIARGVDEEDIAVGLALVEEKNGGGDAGAEEEIGGRPITASRRFS
jgi:hypothetical protein